MKSMLVLPLVITSMCLSIGCLSGSARAAGIQSQYDMNLKSQRDFEKADAELNAVYRRALKGADAGGAKELKSAERAWVVFRDAEAAYEVSADEGGSIYTMDYNAARIDLTRTRIKQLKASE